MAKRQGLPAYLSHFTGFVCGTGVKAYIRDRRAHPSPSVMATKKKMADSTLENKSLPPGAVAELEKVANWLQSPDAKFQTANDVQICHNTEELATVTTGLLEGFARTEVKDKPTESRVTAIHFDSPTMVPVEAEWVVDLIPIHVVEGPGTSMVCYYCFDSARSFEIGAIGSENVWRVFAGIV
ncbi:hypothetical protein O1611_g2007 [Lasiodiplodia mahajangana]|uniref:Uncharacterized protein n=1 Tax=Lasiodiplodia mahajangana TaxID=1108764 RepID=A0ACC2JVZ5_9PEZI|nr:hypothetical protein O1611_g2007 [Lasiodiplodia mahajangana]